MTDEIVMGTVVDDIEMVEVGDDVLEMHITLRAPKAPENSIQLIVPPEWGPLDLGDMFTVYITPQ